jgi:hypothetical protein
MRALLRPFGLIAVLTLVAVACAAPGTPSPSPGPSASPEPTASQAPVPLAVADLKYRLLDRFGPLWYCDPDEFPISHGNEQELAVARLPQIRADAATYRAIAGKLGIGLQVEPDAAQTLAIYREWKMLNGLVIAPANGGYSFDAIFVAAPNAQSGTHVVGGISNQGEIGVVRSEPSTGPMCPICLARGTRIATPGGEIAVEDLQIGMAVWTIDALGHRTAATILHVGSAPVPDTHRVVDLVLDDGRNLRASPGHPLPDGRRLGDLRPGDALDGAVVLRAELVAYGLPRTFDLLPSGETGAYWANGILLRSTLR